MKRNTYKECEEFLLSKNIYKYALDIMRKSAYNIDSRIYKIYFEKRNGVEYMDYMTAQQAADKWGVSLRWVQTYLKDERIEGAVRFGHVWMIPKEAKKPIDGRVKFENKQDKS